MRTSKKLNTLDKILLISFISMLAFTVSMEIMFYIKDAVPDSLVYSFFGIFTGEVGMCTYIWRKKWEKK